MASIAKKIEFATKYMRDPTGRPVRFDDRFEWIINEIWRPLQGFKWWPVDDSESAEYCEQCQENIGTIVEWTWEHPAHDGSSGCRGLVLEPLPYVMINVPRRDGKTFGGIAGWTISTMALERDKAFTFVAGSEDQTKQLLLENFVNPIEASEIASAFDIVANKIVCKKTRSFLEVVPTTHKSITGRGRAGVFIDEARDVAARTFAAILPSIFANNGSHCPVGHVHGPRLEPDQVVLCPHPGCGRRLEPWFGRLMGSSNSGFEDGNEEYTWFNQIIDTVLKCPDKNWHAYKRDFSMNPNVHEGTKNAAERVLSKIESLAAYAAVEIRNLRMRRGQQYIPDHVYEAAFDSSLRNLPGYGRPCIGFFDTSKTKELASINIIADDKRPGEKDWARFAHLFLEVWDPKDLGTLNEDRFLPLAGAVHDPVKVNGRDVPSLIFDLEDFMRRWPGLKLWVDTRVMPWAERLVKRAKEKHPGIGRRIERYQGLRPERDTGYDVLEEYVSDKRARLIRHPVLVKEFKQARVKLDTHGREEVREDRRWIMHLDALDGLAAACERMHAAMIARRLGLDEANRVDDRPTTDERAISSMLAREGGHNKRAVFALLDELHRPATRESDWDPDKF